MENNKYKKSVKFQGDMLNFYDFIQEFVFTTNHHLKVQPHAYTFIFFQMVIVSIGSKIIQGSKQEDSEGSEESKGRQDRRSKFA